MKAAHRLALNAALLAVYLLGGKALAAGITYDAATKVVTATGSDFADTLQMAVSGDNLEVTLSADGAVYYFPFPLATVSRVVFQAGAGDDTALNLSSVSLVASGGAGNDTFSGGSGNDALAGGDGDDQINGGDGADILFGDLGNDVLTGENGNDWIFGGDGADSISGGPGNDYLDGQAGDDTIAGDDGDDVVQGGTGMDFIRGGNGSDNLNGGADDDTIEGQAGNDIINGGDGNDILKGGTENDVMSGGPGDDLMSGDENDDILKGGDGNDVVSGQDGSDELWGEAGDDGVDGGVGPDKLYGGADNDILVGGPGDDILVGGDGNDYLLGSTDIDDLDGGPGDDFLQGDLADSRLEGGTGVNTIRTSRTTRFGIVPNPSHEPVSSNEDIIRSYQRATVLSDIISIFWSYPAQTILPDRLSILDVTHNEGKTSFVQLGVQYFGNPIAPSGMVQSFGDQATRDLFIQNVQELAAKQPNYINLGAELNFLYWINPPEFDNYATLYQEAYAAIKAISPNTQVGVSFHFTLYRACEQMDALQALGPHDYVAFTVYPIWMLDKGIVNNVYQLPPGWWRWMRDTYPNEHILISELGMPNSVNTTPLQQAQFFDKIPELFAAINPDIVSWILLNNVGFFDPSLLNAENTQFLLDVGVDPNILFGRLNNNGLHSHDGIPMPAWFQAVKLDLDSYTGPFQDTIQLDQIPAICARPANVGNLTPATTTTSAATTTSTTQLTQEQAQFMVDFAGAPESLLDGATKDKTKGKGRPDWLDELRLKVKNSNKK